MKACKKCGVYQPLTNFYPIHSNRDGLSGKCKTCTKSDVKAAQQATPDHYRTYKREHQRKYTRRPEVAQTIRERRCTPQARAARAAYMRAYLATDVGREKSLAHQRSFNERNPVKHAAHNIVKAAICSGRLLREPCEVCGYPKSQAHHDDYGKPLSVRWLCALHHVGWHQTHEPIIPAPDGA